MSKLEEKVITLLKRGNIRFMREKTFPDLRKGRFRYDFEIYVDGGRALLEIQGQAHYEFIPKFYKRRADFESAKERDRRKNKLRFSQSHTALRYPLLGARTHYNGKRFASAAVPGNLKVEKRHGLARPSKNLTKREIFEIL